MGIRVPGRRILVGKIEVNGRGSQPRTKLRPRAFAAESGGLVDGIDNIERRTIGKARVIASRPEGDGPAAEELVRKFGRVVDTSIEGLTHLFPRPVDLADAELTFLGISKEKAATINALARALGNGELTFASAKPLRDTVSQLKAIEGISEETGHYIAMRAYGEPDAFPLDNGTLTRALENSKVTPTPDDFPSSPEA